MGGMPMRSLGMFRQIPSMPSNAHKAERMNNDAENK